ncbi:hypothetical protein GCM10010319_66460 [Streptomyces blastmyceticus]|uniref:Uncharacterized protein n=1 Tax=Streptomyces blastmyceticus TaxID=68180 RepID=A0ABN0Y051_9ACTN
MSRVRPVAGSPPKGCGAARRVEGASKVAGARNHNARTGVVFCTGRGGEDTPSPHHGRSSDSSNPPRGYASPARSRAVTPARRLAIRSSRVKPAGASDRVVTPASA